jgi:hypothetical protein
MRTVTLRSFDRGEGGSLPRRQNGSASGGRRRPRTHDQGHRRPAGVALPASELPPIASSCVYSSTFRLFSPAVGRIPKGSDYRCAQRGRPPSYGSASGSGRDGGAPGPVSQLAERFLDDTKSDFAEIVFRTAAREVREKIQSAVRPAWLYDVRGLLQFDNQ